MAQRSSRSKKSRARANDVKKPQLRASRGDRPAKAAVVDGGSKPRRQRPTGPKLRVRPEGNGGLLALSLGGWLIVAGVAALGLALGRWNSYGQADALWLYVAFGMLGASIAVGFVARNSRDALVWVGQATIVALALFAVQQLTQDGCAPGSMCSVLSRHDWVGIVAGLLVIGVLAWLSLLLGRKVFSWIAGRRSSSGRVSATLTVTTMIWAGILLGLPLGAVLMGIDAAARPEPALVADAKESVADCFGITEPPYELAVRPDPTARATAWTSLLVRRASESRKAPTGKKGKLEASSFSGSDGSPYEAVAIYSEAVDETTPAGFDVNCRRISPSAGIATAHDFAPLTETELQQNPIKPKELLTAPASSSAAPITVN